VVMRERRFGPLNNGGREENQETEEIIGGNSTKCNNPVHRVSRRPSGVARLIKAGSWMVVRLLRAAMIRFVCGCVDIG